jgi:hypothetical protein
MEGCGKCSLLWACLTKICQTHLQALFAEGIAMSSACAAGGCMRHMCHLQCRLLHDITLPVTRCSTQHFYAVPCRVLTFTSGAS